MPGNAQVGQAGPQAHRADSLYLAYGSNLWLDQMARRCPRSPFVGVARLAGWRWIINNRGYANVVPAAADVVYGTIYRLAAEDEATLDQYEHVPVAYGKEVLPVELLPGEAGGVQGREETIRALVYVDRQRQEVDAPKEEYVHRMNEGIRDALAKGVPGWYVDRYLRPFIPAEEG
ncbi:MAG: hypothetical protein M1832_000860 [Thelocarpon impressellum]|nr:MAG: hypothetical protein M1832_000860 [Thelocarpon impressellum]